MNKKNKDSKTVQVPIFGVKAEDFTIWWMKFRANTAMKKYHNSVNQNFNLPPYLKNLNGTAKEKE